MAQLQYNLETSMRNAAALRATFTEAVDLVNQGRADESEALCRATIESHPDDANMIALLGAILVKKRALREAETWLTKAIELAPSFAKPHEDLGFALLQQARPKEAVPVLETATRLDPSLELAWLNLGKSLAMLGQGEQADEAFEKSFSLNPVRKKLALAAEHQQAGRYQEAAELYREVLRTNPKNVDALRMLGILAFGEGQVDEAERLFRRAVAAAPDFVNAIIDLGVALKEQSRIEESIECFRQATKLEPRNVKAHYQLGQILAPAALSDEAIRSYERVLELRPKHAGALLGRGHVLKTLGRQEAAIESYRRCIASKPEKGEVYWSLANLKTYRLSDDDIREMQSRLSSSELTDESEVNFLFALGKAHEDRGEFDQAWQYYVDGNAKRRMLEHYDPVRFEVQNDAIIEVFDREFLSANTGLGNPDPAPIFIVGLPRSGSTLLEQILASHSLVEGTAELPYIKRVEQSLSKNRADGVNYPAAVRELGEPHFNSLGQDYLDAAQMHRVEGTAHFIDKMPNNFPAIGLIHLILPNAKIIDARRYPLDSCLSNFRQLYGQGQPFTYDLADIGEYFLEYQRLMDHWHDVLPDRVLTVQYEDVVCDFENQVRRLLEYCELPWDDACLRFHETDRPVRTASSEQVRQPVYTKSVHFWRNHEPHLGELIDVLQPVLDRYRQYETINR
ncbi:MAG: sulfotransferase [Gammaproteobacteria bacterium]|nr:sulfotransferase [Gammaproteobacteria bacterium]